MIFDIVLTSALTIVGGITVYVLGQIASKFYIDPVHELLQTIGKISDTLIFYANVYTNTVTTEKFVEASNILRQHASLLKSKTHVVKWHSFFSRLGFIPDKASITEAHAELIGLSNSMPWNSLDCVKNMKVRQRIEELLKIKGKENYKPSDKKLINILNNGSHMDERFFRILEKIENEYLEWGKLKEFAESIGFDSQYASDMIFDKEFAPLAYQRTFTDQGNIVKIRLNREGLKLLENHRKTKSNEKLRYSTHILTTILAISAVWQVLRNVVNKDDLLFFTDLTFGLSVSVLFLWGGIKSKFW